MLEDHAKYMLCVWINQGGEELVKAMEETLVFPRARDRVLYGCATILCEKHDSKTWGQMSAMIIALYENNLVSKSDIGTGMSTLIFSVAIKRIIDDNLDCFGEFFCQFAVRNLYTLEQLCGECKARAEYGFCDKPYKRVNLIRVCMQKMDLLSGREVTRKFFGVPNKRSLLEEFLGIYASNKLLVNFNCIG